MGFCVSWLRAFAVAALVLTFAPLSAHATAPLSFDRDVTDVTAWVQPYTGEAAKAEGGEWVALKFSNPTKNSLDRVLTIETGAGGILNFVDPATAGVTDVVVDGEGGRASLLEGSNRQGADVHLDALATATFAFTSNGPAPAATWRLWKPEAFAASKRSETLLMGVLAGAVLVMAAWLAGLAVLRNDAEPAWATIALGALIVLILGQAVFALPAEALMVAGAIMVAAALRYVSCHLDWDEDRRRLSAFVDGIAFAIVGLAFTASFGVTYNIIPLKILMVLGPTLAVIVALASSLRTNMRAKSLIPGVVLIVVAALLPALMPLSLAAQLPSLSLVTDAVFTAGALALAFAAAIPQGPKVDQQTVDEMSADQRKAREAEYRYALGLAAAHQGLWDWNFDNDTLFVSPSVEALLGLDAGALQSSERKWAELIVPEDVRIYADSINAHRRQGNSSFTLEMRMRHAKGGSRWIQLRASCMANAQGKAVRCIGVVSDITGRKAQETQRQSDDAADAVTGLMQRAAFLTRLDGALASMRNSRHRRQGAVLAIDVDRLRAVTDSLGHQAGDRFLSQIARRLDHAAGPDDAVARLGTDEFAVLALGSPGDEDGAQVAQRIRDALTQPVAINDREVYPAASIGLALIEPTHRYGGDVLREAEIAMYHAKRAGRGSFEIYQPQMKPRSAERLIMDADLRTALDREQIEMHYQPIVRVEDGGVAGFEALMRWRHPHRGLLSPQEFIALAEETGLIVPLGRYAVEKATAELKRWQSYFPTPNPLFCSVNVSGRQLFRQEFFDDVVESLRREKPARMTLKLELTESVIMQNPDSTARALARLKEAGAGLALDDFGTGFSSLAYLQRFPFDTVKIDRSFVADMAKNEETPVILRSIIRLAHDLDMSVVAEGVETQSEATRLKQLRCEFAQGYLYGAPMDATAAYNFIAMRMRGGVANQPQSRQLSGPSRIPRKL